MADVTLRVSCGHYAPVRGAILTTTALSGPVVIAAVFGVHPVAQAILAVIGLVLLAGIAKAKEADTIRVFASSEEAAEWVRERASRALGEVTDGEG